MVFSVYKLKQMNEFKFSIMYQNILNVFKQLSLTSYFITTVILLNIFRTLFCYSFIYYIFIHKLYIHMKCIFNKMILFYKKNNDKIIHG